MFKPFRSVQGLRPRLTKWNLSYSKKFTTDMGKLIPIMCDEVVPGDVFKIGNRCVIRFQPLVAPILHEVSVYTHYFFVPYRLLWSDWENFITGGEDGTFTGTLPNFWFDVWKSYEQDFPSAQTASIMASGTLWDYLYNGVPNANDSGWSSEGEAYSNLESLMAFPLYAYNFIWNEFYRDENVDDEVALYNPFVLRRRWKKDYFTSALPWRQRGVAPALPVDTSFDSGNLTDFLSTTSATSQAGANVVMVNPEVGPNQPSTPQFRLSSAVGGQSALDLAAQVNENLNLQLRNYLNGNVTTTTFDVNDLRLAFQVQKWLERNARSGSRYTEQLRAHFGVSPTDDRLQRPEYIGGTKQGVIFSEVLQTSSTGQTGATTPQGNMAGHGLSADGNFAGRYKVREYGLIMGIMSVVPKSTYSYGFNRQWLRQTKYDFYFPEFAHLGEQAIQFREIWENFGEGTTEEKNAKGIFGYQGRYDEMRYKPSTVHSGMRKTFDYWHLSREFSACPHLNSAFLECNPSKRIFADQNSDGLIVDFANVITALRPIPYVAEPGLIDHF